MKTVSLSGSLRESVGKKDAASLRRAGLIPAVLYGGDEQIHFSVNEIAVNKLVYTPDVFCIQLEIGEKTIDAVITEMQWHPVTDRIIHIDFLQLIEGKEVKIQMPVQLEGNSIGVRNGGKLRVNFRKLTLKGIPSAFPDAVGIDISEMKIGESVRVGDLNYDNISILEPADAVVVGVKTARGAAADADDEDEAAEGAEAAAEGDEG